MTNDLPGVQPGSASATANVRSDRVDYQAGDKPAEGVLVWDASVKTPRPGLLMIPNWLGINRTTIDFAKEIAGHDYVVFMGDMYGKDTRPGDREQAKAAAGPLFADRGLLRRRVVAAFDQLERLAETHAAPINAMKLGAIGFCFGGTSVLDLARTGSDVAAVVSFHGGLGCDDSSLAKHIRARALVMNGSNDTATMPGAPDFLEEMKNNTAPWQFVVFGGAVHCFAEPWENSPPNCVYNAPVAKRAFALMHDWLDEAFTVHVMH
ncbi:MAG: dienelactone hydrolase family protein [Rhodanobacteraceae bacterium]